ncbi:hypothetical protein AJ88_15665 [Mesorhizobium amorphae CCBAU 01583]|nr:hypothetical protein AJ88_15665 [Mesorhizobium amorphae CCBAU 01583]
MLPERGLPMFTFGFRFALDRLSGYRNAAAKGLLSQGHLQRIEAVLEPLQRLAVTVDFQRPVLSFWRPVPNAAPNLTRAAEAAATTTLPATRRSPMGEALERGRRRGARAASNEEFLQRLLARRPDAEARYRGMLDSAAAVPDPRWNRPPPTRPARRRARPCWKLSCAGSARCSSSPMTGWTWSMSGRSASRQKSW